MKNIFFFTIFLFLSGCAISPPKIDYQSIAASLNANSSQLIGSTVDKEFPFDDEVTTVAKIDGKAVKPQKNLALKVVHSPIILTPGIHTVELIMSQGQIHAYEEFQVDFKLGVTYIAKAEAVDREYAYFWIENFATSEMVTARKKTRRQLSGSMIFII